MRIRPVHALALLLCVTQVLTAIALRSKSAAAADGAAELVLLRAKHERALVARVADVASDISLEDGSWLLDAYGQTTGGYEPCGDGELHIAARAEGRRLRISLGASHDGGLYGSTAVVEVTADGDVLHATGTIEVESDVGSPHDSVRLSGGEIVLSASDWSVGNTVQFAIDVYGFWSDGNVCHMRGEGEAEIASWLD